MPSLLSWYNIPLESSRQAAFNGAVGAYFNWGVSIQLDRKRGYQLKSYQDTVIGHLFYRSIKINKYRCFGLLNQFNRARAVEVVDDDVIDGTMKGGGRRCSTVARFNFY